MIPDSELDLIKSNLLALRKIADQGLLLVEQIKSSAQPERSPKKRKSIRPVKYTALILGGARATKKNTKNA
jgi:hypothetical protein